MAKKDLNNLESLENRVKEFNAEFMPLLNKYRLGLGAVAGLTPDGRIFAKAQLFDDVELIISTENGEKKEVIKKQGFFS